MHKLGVGVALVVVAVSNVAFAASSARELMIQNERATTLAHVVSSSTLTIGGPDGTTRTKSFSLYRKRANDNVHFNTVTRFLAPAEVKGESVLFNEKTNGQNEVLLYLPRYKKVRRVESRAQKSSFMGSSFSYADMTTQAIDDYTHTLEKNEPCPHEPSSECALVSSVPVNETVRQNHGYAKKRTWIRTKDAQTIQTELFDEGGALWKRIVFSNIREVDPSTHQAIPHDVRVDDLKTRRFSVIHVNKADTHAPVSDSLFTAQSLSREI